VAGQSLNIVKIVALMLGVVAAGTLGYRYLMDWPWMEALYMTAITVTTVGFGEVHDLTEAGRVFTILLMLCSVGVVAYSATLLTSAVMETEFRDLISRRLMDRRISAMKDHHVICGAGRTGRAVAEALHHAGLPFVVIDAAAERLAEMRRMDWHCVEGDATRDETLIEAGVRRAGGLVAALGNDAEDVYLILSARHLNPALTIVSWATSQEAEMKIKRAGADHVLSPYVLGGRRLAQMLSHPHTLEFLDHALGGENRNISMGEVRIRPGSPMVGNSLKGAGIRRDLGVIVVGIRRASGEMVFNPSADEVFGENDILIALGSPEHFERLRRMI